MHKSDVKMTVDIKEISTNKIVFKDETIFANASVSVSCDCCGDYYASEIDEFDEDILNDIKDYRLRVKMYNILNSSYPDYKFVVCLKEFCARNEVEDYETKSNRYDDYLILVKEYEFQDLEIDAGHLS